MDKETLYGFFGDRASESERKRVIEWLDSSPENMKTLISERKLYDALTLVGDKRVAEPERSIFRKIRWGRMALRYAAVMLLMIGVAAAVTTYHDRRMLEATNIIKVPAGQRVDVSLPDGTKVCLNALSELEYPTFFAGKNRTVRLKGEAFFDVAHDSDHPFVVETFACNVEVLGTKFDVEADSERREFAASLVEGKVRIKDKLTSGRQVVLRPNERLQYTDGRMLVSLIPEYEEFQWRDGLIAFRNASFTELIGEFEKYYGVKIEIRSRDIPKNVFTGKIRISEGLDHALWILQCSSNFKYSRNDTGDVIFIQ